jgi:hypothetical protein
MSKQKVSPGTAAFILAAQHGHRVHQSTIIRWCQEGKLPAGSWTMSGTGRYLVTLAAVVDFALKEKPANAANAVDISP